MKQFFTIILMCLGLLNLNARNNRIASCTPISNNTIGTTQTICVGSVPTALSGSLPAGGDGSGFMYSWISSTTSGSTGFSVAAGTNSTINYAPAAITQTTWYRRVVSSGICPNDTSAAVAVTVNAPIANNTITGTQVVFNGYRPSQLMGSSPSGGNASYTYLWIVSASPTGNFDSIRNANNNTQHYYPDTVRMSYTLASPPTAMLNYYKYKRIVRSGVCVADTSNLVEVMVSDTLFWTGTQDNNWSNAANWNGSKYGMIKVIPSSSLNNPVITGSASVTRLMIQSGKTLSLANNSSSFTINGFMYGQGNYDGSKGTTVYNTDYSEDVFPGTYFNLTANSSNIITNVTVKNNFTASSDIRLWGQLIIDTNCTYSFPRARFEQPLAKLTIRNIGAGGRTGDVLFPANSTKSGGANIIINNSGVADGFTLKYLDSTLTNGTSGSKVLINSIRNSWIISEDAPGGSNVTVSVFWDTVYYGENPGFTPSASYLAFYDNGMWNGTTPSPAITSGGGRKQTRSGLTIFNNTVFSVGSNGTIPVKLMEFNAMKQNRNVQLTWTTASELNNDYFMIQRSLDGKLFETIDRVNGNATTAKVSEYSYSDVGVAGMKTGALYYRLVQVDFDGASAVSDVAGVAWKEIQDDATMSIHPNPFKDKTTVFVNQQNASSGVLKISDLSGKMIVEKQVALNSGITGIELGALNTENGILFVTIISNEGVITRRLIKQP